MNIDAGVQKIIKLLLKKWKLLIILAIIGAILAGVYTARFTTLTYSSSVEFLTFAYDSSEENSNEEEITASSYQSSSAQRVSETSKMSFAMKMLDTYIEIFSTNEFSRRVSEALKTTYGNDYSAMAIKNAISITKVEDTAMFIIRVTTADADLSYNIAKVLETEVIDAMIDTNNGIVRATVEDAPLRASSAVSLNYPKKCFIGAMAGIILAAAYVILRDLIDIRIKGADDLAEKYNIPVLGTIPNFSKKS